MTCDNCKCARCVKDRLSPEFEATYACTYCGEPGMSEATAYGNLMHHCPEKTAAREVTRSE